MKKILRSAGPRTGWAVSAVLLVLLVWVATNSSDHHPSPRNDVAAETVVPAARYAAYPDVARVYEMAAEIPSVLDGLYCYCDCSQHSGHYSLLDCFRSDHGAGCDICLSEAVLAHRMTRDGASLDEIRDAIDATYGS